MMPDDPSSSSATTAMHNAARSAPTATTTPAADAGAGDSNVPSHPPGGHGLRRVRTALDDLRASPQSPGTQRPKTLQNSQSDASPPFEPPPMRRSSTFSDYSLNEARNLLNPHRQSDSPTHGTSSESSSLASLSLAFALLPALAGILFKNGSAVVTDVMLLGLAGVFLHWSVTQPWAWYHSAQEVRVQNEELADAVFEDSGSESTTAEQYPSAGLDRVPEEEEDDEDGSPEHNTPPKPSAARNHRQQAALRELYYYEILALFSCFVLPLLGAYLLHAIRSQLSRPSEGLVSNYNLTIFLLVSEMRVLSHLLKLLNSRTLHLQRVVQRQATATKQDAAGQAEILQRLESLESRSSAENTLLQQSIPSENDQAKREAQMTRDVRNTIQPELDALKRAVRRYEKKATLLQLQTESRFAALDARLEDAIALAAAAVKNQGRQEGSTFVARAFKSALTIAVLPFKTMAQVLLLLPMRMVSNAMSRKPRQTPQAGKGPRSGRMAGTQGQQRWSNDRVPSRMGKR